MPIAWSCVVENICSKVQNPVRRILVRQDVLIYVADGKVGIKLSLGYKMAGIKIALANHEHIGYQHYADSGAGKYAAGIATAGALWPVRPENKRRRCKDEQQGRKGIATHERLAVIGQSVGQGGIVTTVRCRMEGAHEAGEQPA